MQTFYGNLQKSVEGKIINLFDIFNVTVGFCVDHVYKPSIKIGFTSNFCVLFKNYNWYL